MGAIGKLFSLAFGRILGFFGAWMSGKLLLLMSAVTAFILMLAALNVLFDSLLSGLSMVMPSEFQWGLGLIPPNIPVCISAIITARTALWIFQVKWAIVKIKVQG